MYKDWPLGLAFWELQIIKTLDVLRCKTARWMQDYKKNNYRNFSWKKCCELDASYTITTEIFDKAHDDQDTFPESKPNSIIYAALETSVTFLSRLSHLRDLSLLKSPTIFSCSLLSSLPIFYFPIIFVGCKIRAYLLTPFVSLGEFLRSAKYRLDFQFPRFFRGITLAGSFLFPRSLLGRWSRRRCF